MADRDDMRPQPAAVDEGTHLGASTRALTRLFAVLMLPFTATRRALRACSRVSRAVNNSLAAFFAAIAAQVKWIASIAAVLRAAARPLERALAAVVRWVGRALTAATDAGGRAFAALGRLITAFTRLIGSGLVRARQVMLSALVRLGHFFYAVLEPPVRAVLYLFVRLVTAVLRAIAIASSTLSRVVTLLGRAIASLVRPPAHAVGNALAAIARAIASAAIELARAATHLGRGIASLLGPPARAVVAACSAGARSLAASMQPLVDRLTGTGHRIAYSVGVAFRRARVQATQAAAPIARAATNGASAPSPNYPPSLVPFESAVYQNEYLPRDGVEVHAIITVTAHVGAQSSDDSTDSPEAAEVILLDCSGSMGHPWRKLRAARQATSIAIDALRDGTWFAIVRASHVAETVYPRGGGLAPATPETRKDAKAALGMLWPEGGTAMGQWLTLARDLFSTRPHAIPHAILLTDGKNESETPAALDASLRECTGRFQCDCRGVGTDWDVDELRKVSTRLVGTVDIVADPIGLAADFAAMTAAAMAKRVGQARLRVWTPQGATVRSLEQVAPTIQSLSAQRRPVDRLTGEYSTGAWGEESRDYHVCVRVPNKGVGAEMLAARISLVVGEHVASSALVRAIWTDDEDLSTQISPQVAHYTGQAELATLIQDGVAARRAGDEELATAKLGRAVQLAAESRNDATLTLLANVVDIVEIATGRVQLKADVDAADEMTLDTRSAKTVRVGQSR